MDGQTYRKSFKYRLLPGKMEAAALAAMLETHRRLYNAFLDYRKSAWEAGGIRISFRDLSRKLTADRKENPFYQRIVRCSAQCTLRDLEKSFAAFFRRVKAGEKPGFPRFKGRDFFNSFGFESPNQGISLDTDQGRADYATLHLDFAGAITVKYHRPITGTAKSYRVLREGKKWFLVVSCELLAPATADRGLPAAGIDVGLSSFLTTSEGRHEPNPRYLQTVLPAIRVAARAVARKKKGGKNRRKAVRALRRLHVAVRNSREEHRRQLAKRLIDAYDFVAVEDLDICEMLADGDFARSISDAGWAEFLDALEYKARTKGVPFVRVAARGTTQECSGCGVVVPKDIRVRVHRCPECGLVLDRDENAARNILKRGISMRSQHEST